MRDAGKLDLSVLLSDAANVAENGFVIDAKLADHIAITKEIADFPPTASLLYNNGKPLQEGDLLLQADLAKTYRSIAADGIGHFYGGPFAEAVESWMNANGGIVNANDFARYQIKQRETVKTIYRGHTIIGFPPPSSGGVHVAQILNMIERFNLKQTHRLNPVQHHHIIAEAMKLAFADRAYWLGDPDFAKVPRGLIDSNYARSLSLRIDPTRTIAVGQHGSPPRADEDIFGKHTTHIATADAEGNWVAITTTLNTRFGSKVVIPGTGVIMNNQMDDFAAQPGVPNAYGLIGAEANSIAPGKRPLSSMSPTIVLRDGQPVMTVGAAGGPTIISQVVQIIVNHVDLGMTLPQAVAAARVHHQWRPDKLYVEPALGETMIDRLKAMGHSRVDVRKLGRSQAILLRDDGTMIGVTDPRIEGLAAGID
jgi:gamma-glutamyltranspeptidase/glutathione hydrolase